MKHVIINTWRRRSSSNNNFHNMSKNKTWRRRKQRNSCHKIKNVTWSLTGTRMYQLTHSLTSVYVRASKKEITKEWREKYAIKRENYHVYIYESPRRRPFNIWTTGNMFLFLAFNESYREGVTNWLLNVFIHKSMQIFFKLCLSAKVHN